MINLTPGFGALEPKVDLRDYKYSPASVTGKQIELPESFALTPPSIKDQGIINSCVAHVATSIEEYFNARYCDYHDLLSVGYIYGCRYTYTGPGMYLRDALKTLQKRGVCTHREFPYNEEVPAIINLFNTRTSWATDSNNKITTYFSIDKEELQYNMKKALLEYGPLMVSIRWHSDFTVDKDTHVIKSNFNSSIELHCVMVYGWNKDGWLIQNSWGENWGNGGRAVYSFWDPFVEVWGITDLDIRDDKDMKNKDTNKVKDFFYKLFSKIINWFKETYTKIKCKIQNFLNKE